MKSDDRFIGGPEDCSFTLSEEEKRKAKENYDQFEAELLKELGSNTSPTADEEFEAGQRVLARWYPEETALDAMRKKQREQFEMEILQELNGNTNAIAQEREAARRRVIDRWYPEQAARYKALQASGHAAMDDSND